MNFSLHEQRITLATILRRFKWSLPDNSPHKERFLTTGLMLANPQPMHMVFERR